MQSQQSRNSISIFNITNSKSSDCSSSSSSCHSRSFNLLLLDFYAGRHNQLLQEFTSWESAARTQFLQFALAHGTWQESSGSYAAVQPSEAGFMFELMLSCSYDLTAAFATHILGNEHLFQSVRMSLFALVDYCAEHRDTEAERQAAKAYTELAIRCPQFCCRLLLQESRSQCVTALEYACIMRTFHLAAALIGTDGCMISRRIRGRWLHVNLDLTQYSWEAGSRFAKSPIILFVHAFFNKSHAAVTSGEQAFYKCPAVQLYFTQFQKLYAGVLFNHGVKLRIIVTYSLYYMLLLPTLAGRIFTKGTFSTQTQVLVAGANVTCVCQQYVWQQQQQQQLYDEQQHSMLKSVSMPALRILFPIRLFLQVIVLLIMIVVCGWKIIYNYSLPHGASIKCLAGRWIRARISLSHHIYDCIYAQLIFDLVATIFAEILVVDFGFGYKKIADNVWEIEPDLLGLFACGLIVNLIHACIMMSIDLSFTSRLCFYLLHCMHYSTMFVYALVAPVFIAGYLAYFLLPIERAAWEAHSLHLIGYWVAMYRHFFGMHQLSSAGSRVMALVQPTFYFFIVLYFVNFAIGLMTQRISELQRNIEMRQLIFEMYFFHQAYLSVYRIRKKFNLQPSTIEKVQFQRKFLLIDRATATLVDETRLIT